MATTTTETTTLRTLITAYCASGAVLDDAGNGACGPVWHTISELESIDMMDEELSTDAFDMAARDAKIAVLGHDDANGMASEYRTSGLNGGPNAHRYRVIF